MNMKLFKPLFIMVIVVLLVSLACSFGGGAAPTEAPKPATQAPVEATAPPATEPPVKT